MAIKHLCRTPRLAPSARPLPVVTPLPPHVCPSPFVPRPHPANSRRGYASEHIADLRRTPLYSFYTRPEHGAKMVPFAGYEMPVQYDKSGGHVKEHHAVRSSCGLFDVSHMVQSTFSGPTATAFLSRLLPSDLASMPPYSPSLSVLLTPEGGILDDCVITRWGGDTWYLVTNAGRREEDGAWIRQQLRSLEESKGVVYKTLDDWGLVALQGPRSSAVLQPLLTGSCPPNLDAALFFGQSVHLELQGVPVHVARGGYTGEDGFEISIPPSHVVSLTQVLASQPGVALAGLAARDSLRLEAGLCLYGHDLDESVGTAEAALGWVVGKTREGFFGEGRTRSEKSNNIKRRRVGLVVEKGPPAREGAKVLSADGKEEVGVVTSGMPSPTLGKNIAMAYVQNGSHIKGTDLAVLVRGKPRKAEVVKMPFVEAKYHRAPNGRTRAIRDESRRTM